MTMVKPFRGSHGMAKLYLAAPSLQPLRVELIERSVEGFN
jgi:hypothetical protein